MITIKEQNKLLRHCLDWYWWERINPEVGIGRPLFLYIQLGSKYHGYILTQEEENDLTLKLQAMIKQID